MAKRTTPRDSSHRRAEVRSGVATTQLSGEARRSPALARLQSNRDGDGTGLQGPAYFIPTALVPLLLITHGLVYRLLLRGAAPASLTETRPA